MIALGAGETENSVDFGFVPNATLASIGNQVWTDTNGDGLLNNAETGINGVTVELYTSGQTPGVDAPVATTTTSGNGNYGFSGVLPGNYVVYLPSTPPGAPLSSPVTDSNDNGEDNDDNGLQAGGTGTPVSSPVIALGAGETENSVDFGFVPNATLASIGNQVWTDTNGDGLLNNAETGINGVAVELYTSGQTPGVSVPYATTVTATVGMDDGVYSFVDLPADNYVVYIPVPPAGLPVSSPVTDSNDNGEDNDDNGIQAGGSGTAVSSPVIALGTGETDTTIDFGFYLPPPALATIGNQVWLDADKDGLLNNGEAGINGVTVELYASGQTPGVSAPYATTTTATVGAASGIYSFAKLPAGNYVVYIPVPPVSAPASSLPSKTDLNDNQEDNDDNGIQTATGDPVISPVITLAAGEIEVTIDFGFYLPPSTAVTLASFRATMAEDGLVNLSWLTLMEIDSVGFRLERQSVSGEWESLLEPGMMIAAEGDGQRPQAYAYTDVSPSEEGLATYRLIELDLQGDEHVVAQTSLGSE